MGAVSLVLTVVVLVAVAMFILLFERSRAREMIEDDLRGQGDLPDDGPRHRME